MRTLIIGSTAARFNGVDLGRPSKDVDVFSDVNGEDVDAFWHDALGDYLEYGVHRMATIDELYTIKVSHSPWALKNGSWDKHMHDIVILKQHGAKVVDDLHDLLYRVWEETHGKKRVNLQMDKDAFFADAVTRIYDHDSVHYSVAYGDAPLYESVFKDGQNIEMDMNKVKALPTENIIKLFREEIYATALERWIIPSNYTTSPRLAYARAVKKTITSLTKGWSARFLIENYDAVRTPDMDYVAHHKNKQHLLIPLEESA